MTPDALLPCSPHAEPIPSSTSQWSTANVAMHQVLFHLSKLYAMYIIPMKFSNAMYLEDTLLSKNSFKGDCDQEKRLNTRVLCCRSRTRSVNCYRTMSATSSKLFVHHVPGEICPTYGKNVSNLATSGV
ncbi:hypothetical protein U9M48_008902 [Paspalum notatum var. saurae]|uniref:Uncharacterized protein n=1 Tax=Paspalum notatum var. saurae TaxID=547442 RepID=A0AAQ3SR62_PASNO